MQQNPHIQELMERLKHEDKQVVLQKIERYLCQCQKNARLDKMLAFLERDDHHSKASKGQE